MFFRFHYIRQDILDLKTTVLNIQYSMNVFDLQYSYMKINYKK